MRVFQIEWVSLLCLLVSSIPVSCNLESSFDDSGWQSIFSDPPGPGNIAAAYDEGLFTPPESLQSISSESVYTSLGHPAFPDYRVRIKKSNFCDHTVGSYTGYIDIQARHIFFYFFESRSDPDKDDVVFWTNGGPGCSSSIGLFMELGPCQITTPDGPVPNNFSWNAKSNIFFVDQPIGVGFSYAEYGESVSTTEEAAKDIAAFVSIFFENFSQFKGRPFHLSGESYGGRYLPIFAAEIYDQNAKLVEAGMTPINLQSVMIGSSFSTLRVLEYLMTPLVRREGNGLTDFYTMIPSYVDMQCSAASVAPVLDIASCVRMKSAVPRCQKWMKESCVDQFDMINCGAAVRFCSSEIETPFFSTGRNPYDISKDCEGERSETHCYSFTKHINSYLDRPEVRSLLGVDPSVSGNFTSCSKSVGSAFRLNLDQYHPTQHYIAALLERDVRVLIYIGTYDWICNWVGNERWTLELEWSGKEEFVGQGALREWTIDGKVAGRTRSAKGLTFATIEGAGHMVPYDKPAESLEMVNRWLKGAEL